MFAGLQRELIKVSDAFTPRVIDELYFWEAANLLGVGGDSDPTTVAGVATDQRDMLRRRVLAAQAGTQPPKWEGPDDSAMLAGVIAGG